jgi:hypothetical protein
MTNLNSMSVEQAASKALEVLLYGEYLRMLEPTKYNPGYKGTFEEYVSEEYGAERYVDKNSPGTEYDTASLWQHIKYEGESGSVDGLSAKVEAQHGGEGQGDQYWVVISISDGLTTRYFRRDGWYASYDGGYLDTDTFEVKPAEKVVTVYE